MYSADNVHHPFPDFRCEKIEEKHFKSLRETGGSIEGIASTLFTELWIARFGRVGFAAKDGVLNFLRHRLVRRHDRVVNEVGEGGGIE